MPIQCNPDIREIFSESKLYKKQFLRIKLGGDQILEKRE